MRKFYTSALAVTLGALAAQAQMAHPQMVLNKAHSAADNAAFQAPRPSASQGGERGTPWYTEDFSGGAIPAGWTNVDDLTPIGDPNVLFVWSNDPAAVAVAALNYTPSSNFNSATGANGYLWCNSDRGLPAAPASDHHTVLTSTPIDCSGQTSVQLSFQSLIGVYDYNASDNVKVNISTDGVNWTPYVPFPCLVTGAATPPCVRWSANPQTVELDITSVAANQPAVYIQWEWLGGWEYFWALDDIQLAPVPLYERVLTSSYISHAGDGFEFGRIPRTQLLTDFILGASARNSGANPQTNLVLTVDVTAPGGAPSFSATQTFATVNSGDTAVMEELVTLPGTLDEGLYTVDVRVSSDQDADEGNPLNDTVVRAFELDDDLYGLDAIGVAPNELLSSIGSNSFVDPDDTTIAAQDGLMLFTFFRISANTTIYGLEAMLAANTVEGSQAVFSIHNYADINADPADVTNLLAESGNTAVTATDLTNGTLRAAFFQPAQLTPGDYYAAATLYSNQGAAHIRILDDNSVPQPGDGSLIYLPIQVGANAAGVYGNGNAFGLRMVLDPSISVGEHGALEGLLVYPNPSNGNVTIETGSSKPCQAEVLDVLGAMVHSARFQGRTTLDLTRLAKGVYTLRIVDGEVSRTERLVIR